MQKTLEIGFIGLDTSHVEGFAKLLHEPDNPFYVPGGKITVAYPGGSEDFELSASRVQGYTDLLKDKYDVEMVDSLEEVARRSDAIMITSVDGRVHLDQFKAVAPYKKPVFIDKPFALDSNSAKQIADLADKYNTPLMSCSALRYDESLVNIIEDSSNGAIIGADCFGPMALQPTQTGLFWYGIHAVEMLYTILGTGCKKVSAHTNETHEFVIGEWEDGRIGTVRGNRSGNTAFGSTVHREKGSLSSNAKQSQKPFHASQNDKILEFLKTGQTEIDIKETLEITRFIEAANESRESGKTVEL